jgi:putative oxidoreductase
VVTPSDDIQKSGTLKIPERALTLLYISMKINYALISRSLIALLFVVAGVQKLMNFSMTSEYIGSLPLVGGLAAIATAIVIVIELPVALAFAWGYRVCATGMTLIGFTLLATLLVHNHLPQDLVMILKNLAIVGGIMSCILACNCGKCPMGKK